MPRGVSRRAELAPRARQMRREGLRMREIASALDTPISTVSEWIADPDRKKHAARRRKWAGNCVDCGAATDASAGPGKACERCASCAAQFNHTNRYWTRARVLERLTAYIEANGGIPPTAMEWAALSTAEGGTGLAAAQREFGSWAAAIEACGIEALATGCYGRAGEDMALCMETRERYERGESTYALSDAYNCTPQAITYRIRKAGGELRSLADAATLRWAA